MSPNNHHCLSHVLFVLLLLHLERKSVSMLVLRKWLCWNRNPEVLFFGTKVAFISVSLSSEASIISAASGCMTSSQAVCCFRRVYTNQICINLHNPNLDLNQGLYPRPQLTVRLFLGMIVLFVWRVVQHWVWFRRRLLKFFLSDASYAYSCTIVRFFVAIMP